MKGYILKVKLHYLHPEKMKVKSEWLSEQHRELIKKSGIHYTPTEKLIPNLFDKDEYHIFPILSTPEIKHPLDFFKFH